MRLVLDFDDVIFDAKKFKEKRFFGALASYGISKKEFSEDYARERVGRGAYIFSQHLEKIRQRTGAQFSTERVLRELTATGDKFLNPHILRLIQSVGKKNVTIITQGERMWQEAKVTGSRIHKSVTEVIFTGKGEKKETTLRKICAQHPTEAVIFIDDSFEHFIQKRKPSNLLQLFLPKKGDATTAQQVQDAPVMMISRSQLHRLTKEKLIELAHTA
jgi:FMN phosphatase YigB (HAD superfamily)